jgi:hypothetical protein
MLAYIYKIAILAIYKRSMTSPEHQQSYMGLFVSIVARVLVPQTLMSVGMGYLAKENSTMENPPSLAAHIGGFGAMLAMANVIMLPPALAILHQTEIIASRIAAVAQAKTNPPAS